MKRVSLKGQCVDTVQTFEYLGTLLDCQLNFYVLSNFTAKSSPTTELVVVR